MRISPGSCRGTTAPDDASSSASVRRRGRRARRPPRARGVGRSSPVKGTGGPPRRVIRGNEVNGERGRSLYRPRCRHRGGPPGRGAHHPRARLRRAVPRVRRGRVPDALRLHGGSARRGGGGDGGGVRSRAGAIGVDPDPVAASTARRSGSRTRSCGRAAARAPPPEVESPPPELTGRSTPSGSCRRTSGPPSCSGHVLDLDVSEVARRMGIGPPTVRVHLHRGRKRLRELLGEEEVDDA